MKSTSPRRIFPAFSNVLLALLSAVLLILAFPDFELSFLAWFALIPLFIAVEREKESSRRSLLLGWIWGAFFYFGTCWWLTFAPITYAGFHAMDTSDPAAPRIVHGFDALVTGRLEVAPAPANGSQPADGGMIEDHHHLDDLPQLLLEAGSSVSASEVAAVPRSSGPGFRRRSSRWPPPSWGTAASGSSPGRKACAPP